jgi:DNA-binding response OmpR family regulator
MKRVLLVIDDYGELLFLQTLLKKLGFDVDGIQNERAFEDSFLALNPEIVIATAKGKRINGLEIAEGIRKVRGLPKVILLATGAIWDRLRGLEIPSVDGVLESPVAASQLLGMIADLAELDKTTLLEKYRRLKATLNKDSEADAHILQREEQDSGQGGVADGSETPKQIFQPTTLAPQDRQKKYDEFLAKEEPLKPARFPRERVHQFTKEIRASEDPVETAKLEEERQGFVKAMFRKAKS